MPFRGLARTISIWFGSQSLCSQLHLPVARHTTQSWATSGPKTYCKRPFCSPLTARKGIVVGSHLWSSQSAPFAFCPTLYMSVSWQPRSHGTRRRESLGMRLFSPCASLMRVFGWIFARPHGLIEIGDCSFSRFRANLIWNYVWHRAPATSSVP